MQPATASARVAALGDVLPLPSIGAVAGRVPKKSPATAKLASNSLLAGAKKVWLDRKVRATALTGGGRPAGLTGTWPDRRSRRLEGRLHRHRRPGRGARHRRRLHPPGPGRPGRRPADFTAEGGDAVDHNGHGTHVASTIAGTGVAANGQRRGWRRTPGWSSARSSTTTARARTPGSSPAWSGPPPAPTSST
ncbi:hypothetical protein NKG94_06150 [Micromonospora sp. M12]